MATEKTIHKLIRGMMITRKEFSEQVERLIATGKGNTDVMSAIIKICEVNKESSY